MLRLGRPNSYIARDHPKVSITALGRRVLAAPLPPVTLTALGATRRYSNQLWISAFFRRTMMSKYRRGIGGQTIALPKCARWRQSQLSAAKMAMLIRFKLSTGLGAILDSGDDVSGRNYLAPTFKTTVQPFPSPINPIQYNN